MVAKSDIPTRSEIERNVEDHEQQMSEKLEELEVLTEDVETVRNVQESLDLQMTAEGIEEIKSSVDAAEDGTIELFNQEDDNLEEIQDVSQDYADEIGERHDSAESDLEKLSDASSEVQTSETTNELANAEAAVSGEMEFLRDNNQKEKEAMAECQRAEQELQNRINSR